MVGGGMKKFRSRAGLYYQDKIPLELKSLSISSELIGKEYSIQYSYEYIQYLE